MEELLAHPSQEFIASIGDITGLLSLEETTEQALQRVTDLAASVLTAADGVGITLVAWAPQSNRPEFRTAAYSAPWVRDVDLIQYETQEGPCVDATVTGTVVNFPDLDAVKYPRFSARASAEGLKSVLAASLNINDRAVGALNLYSRKPAAFDITTEETAVNFAAQAAVVLVNIELYEGARALSHQLGDAMESRAVIEQAKGVLMSRDRCSPDDAYAQLKNLSQAQNVKVQQIALTIVQGAQHN